jgi:ferrochelatase
MNPNRGILLVNLGSPDSTAVPDVRCYLREFLMDERVIDTNPLLRWIVAHCLVSPRNTACAYRRIWTAQGSPLITTSKNLQRQLQQQTPQPIALGMRYGNPSIRAGLETLRAQAQHPRPREILLIPLYPHYAMATWESAITKTREDLASLGWNPRLTTLPPFYNQPPYLDALAANIREQHPAAGHLLFSYHGLPLRHLKQKDPTGHHCLAAPDCCQTPSPAHASCYRHQCQHTTAQIAKRLSLAPGQYTTAYQSRFGKEPWCHPVTGEELIRLAKSGTKHISVTCPSFIADCLETLEEIGITGKETFLANGGETFRLITCLNEHPRWIETLRDWSEHFPENWY